MRVQAMGAVPPNATRSFLAALSILTLLLGCGEPAGGHSSQLFRDLPPAETANSLSAKPVELRQVAHIGSLSGPHAFGQIGAVAARDDGLIAVYDQQSCEITLLRMDDELTRRFGRCGGGPGEYRSVVNLAFRGDTLLVNDEDASSLFFVDLSGAQLRSIRLSNVLPHGAAGLGAVDDTTLIVGNVLLPSEDARAGDDPGRQLVLFLQARDATIQTGAVRASDVAEVNPGRRIAEFAEVCLGRENGKPVIAVMNAWAFEGVTIDAHTRQVMSHTLTPLKWHVPFSPRYPGRAPSLAYRPGPHVSAVACTARGALYWARRNDWEAVPPRNMGAYAEFRGYDGSLLYKRFIPADDSLYLGLPMAGWGEYVIFVRNGPDVPHLSIVQVRPRS